MFHDFLIHRTIGNKSSAAEVVKRQKAKDSYGGDEVSPGKSAGLVHTRSVHPTDLAIQFTCKNVRNVKTYVQNRRSPYHVFNSRSANIFTVRSKVKASESITFTLTYDELLQKRFGAYEQTLHTDYDRLKGAETYDVIVTVTETQNIVMLKAIGGTGKGGNYEGRIFCTMHFYTFFATTNAISTCHAVKYHDYP